jgi:hypothetical protein
MEKRNTDRDLLGKTERKRQFKDLYVYKNIILKKILKKQDDRE